MKERKKRKKKVKWKVGRLGKRVEEKKKVGGGKLVRDGLGLGKRTCDFSAAGAPGTPGEAIPIKI